MRDPYYGNINQVQSTSKIDIYVEEIKTKGFTTIENILSTKELEIYRTKIDTIYKIQEESFGKENLNSINEILMCRVPLKYDDYFINIATTPIVMEIIKKILGEFFILNLQNAIINTPNKKHHQSSWHRDLPYQNFVISSPIAINALFCIDDFSVQSGGTVLLPHSHKSQNFPSDEYLAKNSITPDLKAGTVIIFDSMLFHKAGYNSSKNIRRAVNHIYTIPIMKQFYNFPKLLNSKFKDDSFLKQLLGYTSQTPLDDVEWRENRVKR